MTDDQEPMRPGAPPWLLIALVVVGVAAAAFAIGRFTAFGASAVAPAPSSSSADAGFARDMQVHHQQAVEMAMIAYRSTDDEELRTLSYDIATGQAAQSGQLYEWLVDWGLPQTGGALMSWMAESDEHSGHGGSAEPRTDEQLRADMGMATDAELAELRAASGQAADCVFLELMIRHHEGAVAMVDAVLELGTQQRVKDVASSMAETQTAEIAALRSIQQRLGCTG